MVLALIMISSAIISQVASVLISILCISTYCSARGSQDDYEALLSLSVGMTTFHYNNLFVCIFLFIVNFFLSHKDVFLPVIFLYLSPVTQIYDDETLQGFQCD